MLLMIGVGVGVFAGKLAASLVAMLALMWQRIAGVISPKNAGDAVDLGTGRLTSGAAPPATGRVALSNADAINFAPFTTSPTITVSGVPAAAYSGVVEITKEGAVGVAEFRWSTDGGATWVASAVATAATVALGATGLTVAFPAGTYYRPCRYTWTSVVVPSASNTAIVSSESLPYTIITGHTNDGMCTDQVLNIGRNTNGNSQPAVPGHYSWNLQIESGWVDPVKGQAVECFFQVTDPGLVTLRRPWFAGCYIDTWECMFSTAGDFQVQNSARDWARLHIPDGAIHGAGEILTCGDWSFLSAAGAAGAKITGSGLLFLGASYAVHGPTVGAPLLKLINNAGAAYIGGILSNAADAIVLGSKGSDPYGVDATAILMAVPTGIKAMTSVARAALTPAEGWVVADTDLHRLCYYNGTAWRKIVDEAI